MFLLKVESLVCTVEIEMIGPSRSAGAGRDALPVRPAQIDLDEKESLEHAMLNNPDK